MSCRLACRYYHAVHSCLSFDLDTCIQTQQQAYRVQAAMATIQQQEGDAVVVDGYKSMYQRLVAQRGALVERSVDLEYRNQVLEARIAELEAQRAASLPTAPALNVSITSHSFCSIDEIACGSLWMILPGGVLDLPVQASLKCR